MPHEPKRRHSRERKGKRRASIKFETPAIAVCKNCGSAIVPHRICPACGYYKGAKVI